MLLTSLQSITSASLLPPLSSPNRRRRQRTHPPIFISTNPSHVDLLHLRHLLASAGHSCSRFPAAAGDGLLEPDDLGKLRTAIDHSFIVVSVFCKARFLLSNAGGAGNGPLGEISVAQGFVHFFERAARAPSPDHQLVGFGRAVSDRGLTASIHDVVVMPSLQKRGIGQRIVERIIRILTNKGIYDISALCSEREGLFFEACGFAKDYLDSTTVMYMRTASSDRKGRKGGFQNTDQANGITLAIEDRPVVSYPSISSTQPQPQFEDYPQTRYPYPYLRQPLQLTSRNRHSPPAQPPPQPPLNAAYLPTLFPRHTNRPPGSYITSHPQEMWDGLGAGALAAGTVIFGDDLISGVGFPTGLDGGSLIVSTDL